MQMEVKAVPVTTTAYKVEIDGATYDAVDMFETLEAVDDGDVVVERGRMADMLLKQGVLADLGSQRWLSGARKGPAYQEFMDALVAALGAAGW